MAITTNIHTLHIFKQILWYRHTHTCTDPPTHAHTRTHTHTHTETTELHFFADSSNQVYGVVVYLRLIYVIFTFK